MNITTRGEARRKRHVRIRLNVSGTGDRPRLAVYRSLKQIYAQVIDDSSGRT
ncbi:MAG: 50S ribosomal protein L18, partial [Candidatus Limnocylindrales bacterium]